MILVADSGSTKTEWITDCGLDIQTQGINPVRDSLEQIQKVIRTELMPCLVPSNLSNHSNHSYHSNPSNHSSPSLPSLPSSPFLPIEVHFYGAGCIQPFMASVEQALHEALPEAHVSVGSDLLGAARALCGNDLGIACILGTGSNSCLCNDGEIVENTHPLGYILGDEGSGAVLGRTLVGEMLKGSLSHLWPKFKSEMNLTEPDIINKVYREPMPNRFLASLVPFIARHSEDASIRQMLKMAFMAFVERNIIPYNHPELPINFVGGIAAQFEKEIGETVMEMGLKMGKILKRPAIGMLKYHLNN